MSKTMEYFRVLGRSTPDIVRDVNTILKEHGIEEEEYFFHENASRYHGITTWPEKHLCHVACYPVLGRNEGIYVHLDLIFQKSGEADQDKAQYSRSLGLAKCWTWASACQIANTTSKIFEGPDAWKRRDDTWHPADVARDREARAIAVETAPAGA